MTPSLAITAPPLFPSSISIIAHPAVSAGGSHRSIVSQFSLQGNLSSFPVPLAIRLQNRTAVIILLIFVMVPSWTNGARPAFGPEAGTVLFRPSAGENLRENFQTKLYFFTPPLFLIVTTFSDFSAFRVEFTLLLHPTLVPLFSFHHIQSRLVHLFGRVGRPQPAAILSLVQVSQLHEIPLYWYRCPRISYANFPTQTIRDVLCPNQVTKRKSREATQPP